MARNLNGEVGGRMEIVDHVFHYRNFVFGKRIVDGTENIVRFWRQI